MKFRWEIFDELVKQVEGRVEGADIRGTSVREIVMLVLSLAFLMSVYSGGIEN